MALAKRVIPTLLCRGRTLVKGRGFDAWRSVGHALQAARIHQARGVDELVILDIGATPENRGPDLALVEELSEGCFMPLAVGGGVRSVEDVRALLKAGADKVVIGTSATIEPTFIAQCAHKVGSQAIVVAIDVAQNLVYTHCGQKPTCYHPVWWALRAWKRGAGEILLTDMIREGSLLGYNLELTKQVADAVEIPVIAHGGAGCYGHMHEAIQAGASAVAAGALFQFTDATPKGAAQYLAWKGIEARL
jgi:cyclase